MKFLSCFPCCHACKTITWNVVLIGAANKVALLARHCDTEQNAQQVELVVVGHHSDAPEAVTFSRSAMDLGGTQRRPVSGRFEAYLERDESRSVPIQV